VGASLPGHCWRPSLRVTLSSPSHQAGEEGRCQPIQGQQGAKKAFFVPFAKHILHAHHSQCGKRVFCCSCMTTFCRRHGAQQASKRAVRLCFRARYAPPARSREVRSKTNVWSCMCCQALPKGEGAALLRAHPLMCGCLCYIFVGMLLLRAFMLAVMRLLCGST